MTTRPYHHGNLRAALLESAERHVREHGVAGLSLREIARQVGVSHAAPRRHFSDRQALLDALALDGFDRLERVLTGAAGPPGRPFEGRLAALGRAYVGFATEHAALLELMFAAKHRAGVAPELEEAGARAFAAALSMIFEARERGEVTGDDPERVGIVIFAAFQGLASLANTGMLRGFDVDDIVTAAIEQLVDGLRPR